MVNTANALKLDDTGDIEIVNNKPVWIEGTESIQQHLKIKLQTFLGEWFLDTSVGVPWYQDILKKNPQFTVVSAHLRNCILDTEGVLELSKFEFDYNDDRTLGCEFTATTTDEPINFSETIEV